VSHTFHGRDIFAPAAAHLARGVEPGRLGPPVADPVRLSWPELRVSAGRVAGAVVRVDRFGNLVTSIHADAIAPLGSEVAVRVGGRTLALVRTYGELGRNDPGALVGSSNRLEIAVNAGSAAKALRAGPGTPVVVSRTSSGARRVWRRR
jgi:S-adenosylmethionine hydrolase